MTTEPAKTQACGEADFWPYNQVGAPTVCEEAKALLVEYLDALEEYDRRHLMFLAACRRNDAETMEGYRGLLRETKLKVQATRGLFREHQKTHNCSEIIRFEDELSSNA